MADARVVVDDVAAMVRLERLMEKRFEVAGDILKIVAQRKISITQPLMTTSSGRLWGLNPSKPGFPPKVVTGDLMKGVIARVATSSKVVRCFVGSNTPYALTLEFGSSRLAARPWLRPSMAEAWPMIVKALAK